MYFKNVGTENTDKTLELAVKAAQDKGIRYLVVATTGGDNALKLKDMALDDLTVVAVTHVQGFEEPGKNQLSEDRRALLEAAGIRCLTTSHALSGGERGISRAVGGMYPLEIIANSLRMLGHGTKVCVEVSIMAVDAGFVPYGEPVVVVAGTSSGADTALIITPAHANAIFETKIHEVICKPEL